MDFLDFIELIGSWFIKCVFLFLLFLLAILCVYALVCISTPVFYLVYALWQQLRG